MLGQLLVFSDAAHDAGVYDEVVARLDRLEGFRHPLGDARNEYERVKRKVQVAGEPTAQQRGNGGFVPALACGDTVDAWVYESRLGKDAGVFVPGGDWRRYMEETGEDDLLEPFGESA